MEKVQLQVTGTHVPDAGVTQVHKFSPRSICDKIAIVRVMNTRIVAGTKHVELGKTGQTTGAGAGTWAGKGAE